jgi:hypothetical protein
MMYVWQGGLALPKQGVAPIETLLIQESFLGIAWYILSQWRRGIQSTLDFSLQSLSLTSHKQLHVLAVLQVSGVNDDGVFKEVKYTRPRFTIPNATTLPVVLSSLSTRKTTNLAQ